MLLSHSKGCHTNSFYQAFITTPERLPKWADLVTGLFLTNHKDSPGLLKPNRYIWYDFFCISVQEIPNADYNHSEYIIFLKPQTVRQKIQSDSFPPYLLVLWHAVTLWLGLLHLMWRYLMCFQAHFPHTCARRCLASYSPRSLHLIDWPGQVSTVYYGTSATHYSLYTLLTSKQFNPNTALTYKFILAQYKRIQEWCSCIKKNILLLPIL